MANPNLVNVTSITGESVQAALTTTLTTEILAAASDTLVKVNSIIIANIDCNCKYSFCTSRCNFSCSR